MDKHTPRPWIFTGGLVFEEFTGQSICSIHVHATSKGAITDREVFLANGELIASAPLLLEQNRVMKEALENIIKYADGYSSQRMVDVSDIAKQALKTDMK